MNLIEEEEEEEEEEEAPGAPQSQECFLGGMGLSKSGSS